MQTLEQTLSEVEPIFRDGSFTMPSFQEVLTARQFAEEINSGKLSIREAYEQFWSYEDKELNAIFEVSGKYLLPAWQKLLIHLAEELSTAKVEELIKVIQTSYLEAGKMLTHLVYNPFSEDYEFSFVLAAKNPLLKEKYGKETVEQLFKSDCYETFYQLLARTARLKYYDCRLLDLLRHRSKHVRWAAVEALADIGHYDPALPKLLDHGSYLVRWAAVELMNALGQSHPKMMERLSDDVAPVKDAINSDVYNYYKNPLFHRHIEKLPHLKWLRDQRAEYARDLRGNFLDDDKGPKISDMVKIARNKQIAYAFLSKVKEKFGLPTIKYNTELREIGVILTQNRPKPESYHRP